MEPINRGAMNLWPSKIVGSEREQIELRKENEDEEPASLGGATNLQPLGRKTDYRRENDSRQCDEQDVANMS